MTPRQLFLALPVLLAAIPSFAVPPPRHFPLDPGNRWTYIPEAGRPGGERFITVLGVEDDLFRVDMLGTEIRIGGLPEALDIELEKEGLVPYYRFLEESFIHRDVMTCEDGRTLAVGSRTDTVETPFGIFTDCLRLDYTDAGPCSDAGRISEWWQLEIGLVQFTEQSIIGPRGWVLQDFDRNVTVSEFRRADADADGEVVLTDAVFVLGWLFSGGPKPSCLDAADANDDGVVDIADPIATLGYLFLGTAEPPPPGPLACGIDGTEDDLEPCGNAGCEDTLTE